MYKKIFGILIIILFFINFTGCMDNKKKNLAPSQIPYSLAGTVTAHDKILSNFTLIFYRNYSEQGRVRTDSNGTWEISNLSGDITIKSDVSGWILALYQFHNRILTLIYNVKKVLHTLVGQ